MHRTQIYLADEQDRALSDRARSLGRTKSALIREAIDGYLMPPPAADSGLARLRAAVGEAAGAAPHLAPGAEYVETLRAADRERAQALDERR